MYVSQCFRISNQAKVAHIANVTYTAAMIQLANQMTYVGQQLATFVNHSARLYNEGLHLNGCNKNQENTSVGETVKCTRLNMAASHEVGREYDGKISRESMQQQDRSLFVHSRLF